MTSSTARGRALPGPRALPRSTSRALLTALTVAALVAGGSLPAAVAAGTAEPGPPRSVVGTIERLHVDNFAAAGSGDDELTFVTTGTGAVQVAASGLAGVADGSTVDVDLAPGPAADGQDPEAGARVSTVDVVATPSPSLTDTGASATRVSASAVPAKHSVLVVVVTPAGGTPSSVSASTIAALVDGSVDAYWTTVTNGAVGFEATPWPDVVSTTSTPCSAGGVTSSFTFWDEVAARVGFHESAGKHLLVYFKGLAACGGVAGLGSVGSGTSSGGVVWSNGYATTGVLGHELGHNLGLGHSQELDCVVSGARVMDAPAGYCRKRSYWDTNDIMAVSWQNQGFLNASHLRKLGILDAVSEATPTDNGEVTLSPLELRTGVRALTLTAGTDRYVVEYRRPVGLDAWMPANPGWGSEGVTVRREFGSSSTFARHESYLLDGRPATPDAAFGELDTALPVGVWLNLAGGNLGLRVVSQSSTGAVIEYRNGPASSDVRYVAPPRPSLNVPVSGLVMGVMKATTSGPVVPMRWSWRVTTPSTNPAAAATVTAGSAATVARAAASGWSGAAYRASVVASDGTVVSAVGRSLVHYTNETLASTMRYSSGWVTQTRAGALSSRIRATAKRGGYVTFMVTARSFGLLLQRGTSAGSVAIYVDGRLLRSMSLRASTSSTRLAWTVSYPTSGRHSVKVVNLTGGTSGQFGFDGLVSLV